MNRKGMKYKLKKINPTSFRKEDPRITGKKQSKEHIEKRSIPLRKKFKVKCENCNQNTEITPSMDKNLNHHFCSKECYYKWYSDHGNEKNWEFTEKGREILKNKMLGDKNPRHEIWNKMSEEEKQEWIKNMRVSNSKRPTKPEIILKDIIKRNNLEYKYVGDGTFWIGRINPDFISSEKKKIIIEVYGDYWHNLSSVKELDNKKDIFLEEKGWSKLIFWEKELHNDNEYEVINKIKEFEYNLEVLNNE